MTNAILFVAVLTVILVALYIAAHKLFPTWGTLAMNAIAGVGAFVDQLQVLPWNTILTAEHAAQVMFSLALANIIARFNGPKLPVGNP